jgi:acetyl-CoA/propionyl-CoA carboxylase, biotin carboxylase, biotin carboxyl carrier protein
VIPFHRTVVDDPAFTAADGEFAVYTRWIETDFVNEIEPYVGEGAEEEDEEQPRESVTVEVGGRRLEVVLPAGFGAVGAGSARDRKAKKRGRKSHGGGAVSGDALTSPMQGTVVKVTAEEGSTVSEGDPVVVIEAMKMEQPINAHKSGTVTGLTVEVGASLSNGAVICEIKDG